MLLQRLLPSPVVTLPAIWGKLPGHADFVRSGMRHGESESWEAWLAEHAQGPGPLGDGMKPCALPVAFVLPPQTLDFSPRHFVIGAIKPSKDKVGRPHALLVYQLARASWVKDHFQTQAAEPRDWLFWLARSLARHTGTQGDARIQALERTVHALWRLHAPTRRDGGLHGAAPGDDKAALEVASQTVLLQLGGAEPADDPALALRGVRHLPWADWPLRLMRSRAESAFWQQDARGGYVSAADDLTTLWSGVS